MFRTFPMPRESCNESLRTQTNWIMKFSSLLYAGEEHSGIFLRSN